MAGRGNGSRKDAETQRVRRKESRAPKKDLHGAGAAGVLIFPG